MYMDPAETSCGYQKCNVEMKIEREVVRLIVGGNRRFTPTPDVRKENVNKFTGAKSVSYFISLQERLRFTFNFF